MHVLKNLYILFTNKSDFKRKLEFMNIVKIIDPEIGHLIEQEAIRQRNDLDLIASENYAHPAIIQAVGSALTNKYAEGYPGKRYYSGCQFVDQVETLAIERCKQLFGAEHVNVQPHSGSSANMAVYMSVLKPGDTILGMSLSAGGHLTHGHNVNFSGTLYKTVQYGVNKETEQLDYSEIETLAKQHRPKLIIAGASAYSRFIDFEKFAKIAQSVDAYFMADIAHIAGLIAAKLHPSPVGLADFVTSTTHKTLRGPRGGLIMCKEKFKDNIDRSIMPGMQGGPLMNIIAGKAVAFLLASEEHFKIYQQQVITNAKFMAQEFAKLDYRVVAGGTDNHLFILDLRSKNITGKVAESALESAGICVSRSGIPFDTEKPWITSGIRIGTPAITTRGIKEKDIGLIVHLIDEALKNSNNSAKLTQIKSQVTELCLNFKIGSL